MDRTRCTGVRGGVRVRWACRVEGMKEQGGGGGWFSREGVDGRFCPEYGVKNWQGEKAARKRRGGAKKALCE